MEVTDLVLPTDLELHTPVLHLAQVGHRGALAHVGRDGLVHQHALGVLVVVVHAEGEAAVEQAQVQTQVGLLGLLPADGRVGQGARGLSVLHRSLAVGAIVVVLAAVHQGRVAEVADVLVTVAAPARAELDLVDPVRAAGLEPRLVGDVPAQGSGREGRPLVAGAEAGGAVAADRHLQHVPLVEVVVEAEEVGGEALVVDVAGTAGRAFVIGVADGGVDVGEGGVGLLEPVVRTGDVNGGVAHRGLSEDGGEIVLSDLLVVGEVILHLPAEAFVHAHRHPALEGLVHGTLVLFETVAAVAPESEVGTEAALELEVLGDIQLGGEVAHELVRIVDRVGRGVQIRERVGQFLVAGRREGIDPAVGGDDGRRMGGQDSGGRRLIGIHRNRRVEGHGGTEDRTEFGVGGDALGSDEGIGEVGRDGQLVEVVAVPGLKGDVRVVGTQRETVVVGLVEVAAHDTGLAEIAQGQEIGGLFGTAAHGQLVLGHGRVIIEGLVLPVGALSGRRDLLEAVEGSAAVVDAGFVHDGHVLLGIQDLFLAPGVLPAVAAVISNGSLAFLAALGGHEDHAVRGTGAVDGGRSGILEDFHGLDIRRVQVVDAAVHRHAVHDVQRVGVVDGADTADLDLGTGTRLTGCLGDLDTGNLALEGVVHGGGADRVQGVAVHFGDGGRDDALLLDTVTYDHGFVQHLGVVLQDDDQFLVGRHGHGLGRIADAADLHDGTLRGAEDEFAVHTGHGAVLGALLNDESADDRLTGAVMDDPFQGDVLRQGRQAHT